MPFPTIPQGRPLAQLLRQLWKEQEQVLLASLHRYGSQALLSFNPEAWQPTLLARIQPIYARYLIDGRNAQQARLAKQTKSLSFMTFGGQHYSMSGGEPHDPDDPDNQNDAFTIYNPEAVNFINQYSYAFAQSTNNTTRMRLDNAYKRFQEGLAEGIEEGQALKTMTENVMRIFRNPQRAMAIAASESSRAWHGGQEIAAKQSGVVSGKRWLASADACEICLSLDGKIVPLGEPFAVIGTGPYARILYPPAHTKCQCSMTDELSDEWNPGETTEDWFAHGR